MHRNLDRRVETLVRLDDQAIQHQLREILDLGLADEGGSWTLDADGQWHRVAPPGAAGTGRGPSVQDELQRLRANA
jgi:polyphosphate kinase